MWDLRFFEIVARVAEGWETEVRGLERAMAVQSYSSVGQERGSRVREGVCAGAVGFAEGVSTLCGYAKDGIPSRHDISLSSLDSSTMRDSDTEYRRGFMQSLSASVFSRSGFFLCKLATRRGSIPFISNETPDSAAGYTHGRVLEEGGIHDHILETEYGETGRMMGEDSYVDYDVEEGMEEVDRLEHPNARMQWTWTDIRS
ncbi:hypothetical protein J1614_008038 [Plenodomus biglobosus]|nr:hypothetical protein J1614_008038 [Plenodomus biglobosus]